MKIQETALEYTGLHEITLTWMGEPDRWVVIFLNGNLLKAPFLKKGYEGSVRFSSFAPFTFELHEVKESETVTPAAIPLVRRPKVSWSPKRGALRYRIYFMGMDGVTREVGSVRHDDALSRFEYQSQYDLRQDGAFWGFMRVEATDALGRESVRPCFPVPLPGVPKSPSGVQVSGSNGRFDITLEV